MSFDSIFKYDPSKLKFKTFWKLQADKAPSSIQATGGNFLNFSSKLDETLMMRLTTKEKYVLQFDFLIWSLKVWFWISVFWISLLFWYLTFLLLCTKPPSSVQTTEETSWIFFSELKETIMMTLITKERYMSYDSVFRYDPSKLEIEPCC